MIENCGAPCYHNITFFDRDQVQFSQSWVFAWSLASLASCAFTVATFLVDRSRFPYPERPIVYLALCYGAAAAVLIIGYAHGDDIACNHSVYNRDGRQAGADRITNIQGFYIARGPGLGG